MKILYIIPALTIGGAEKLVVDILISLKNRNFDVSLLTLQKSDSFLVDRLSQYDIPINSLDNQNIYSISLILKIRPYLNKYDIVHVHLFPTLYWVSIAKILTFNRSFKLFYTEHSTYNKRRNKRWLRFIEQFVYKQYDCITSITKQVQDNLLLWINIKKENKKFCVINNGVDVDYYKNARAIEKESLKISSNVRVIFMVARFTAAKDHKTLLYAMKLIKSQNAVLLLAGSGPTLKENEKLVSSLDLSNKVIFLGNRNDVPNLIKTSDLCILSSNWEGFGLSAVEYMASGKPVIASNIDGVGDIVRDAGILFEKGNSLDLANKIDLLLSDTVIYDDVSKRCEIRANNYDLSKMVDQYIGIYRNNENYD